MSEKALELAEKTSSSVAELVGCVTQIQRNHQDHMGELKEMRKDIHEIRVDQAKSNQQMAQNQKDIIKVIGDQSELRVEISNVISNQNDMSNQLAIINTTKSLLTSFTMKWGGNLIFLALIGAAALKFGVFK